MAQAILPVAKKKLMKDANQQEPTIGQSAGTGVLDSPDVSHAMDITHGDTNDDDGAQNLARQAMNMVDAGTEEASNELLKEPKIKESALSITLSNDLKNDVRRIWGL